MIQKQTVESVQSVVQNIVQNVLVSAVVCPVICVTIANRKDLRVYIVELESVANVLVCVTGAM